MTTPDTAAPSEAFRILIVDDDDTIRDSVAHYLMNFHSGAYRLQVSACADCASARALLAQRNRDRLPAFDLIISDIHLPDEDGFKLLRHVREASPDSRIALMTAYQIDDYIRLAKETGVLNIIAKTAPFNFEELSSVVDNLLNAQASFGLSRYLNADAVIVEETIQKSADIMTVFYQLRDFFSANPVRNVDGLSTALLEAITNAVYHAIKLPDGSQKYRKGQEIEALDPCEWVQVQYGRDAERIGVSIVDQGGRITADDILYWLERNISGAGLLDTHGRGVYLMHTLVDRLIFNLHPGHRTEIIVIDYFSAEYSANKPLYINQLCAPSTAPPVTAQG
ncbi:MAG: response regulator [Vampirovibrionales bacterium]|nr:response regulator [Vampirovibrionales bacterium]